MCDTRIVDLTRRSKPLVFAFYTSKTEVKKLIADLESEFKITAKAASYFLQLEIKVQQGGSIKICQEGYTNRILERFGMAEGRPSQCRTAVPHCCKGDTASQWEMAILGVSES